MVTFYGNPGAKGKQSTPDVWRLFKIIQDYIALGFHLQRCPSMDLVFVARAGLGHVRTDFPCVQKWGGRCSTETRSTKESGMVQKPVKQHSTGHGFTFSIVFPLVFTFPLRILRCSNGVPWRVPNGAVPGTRGKPSEIWTLIKTAKWVGLLDGTSLGCE